MDVYLVSPAFLTSILMGVILSGLNVSIVSASIYIDIIFILFATPYLVVSSSIAGIMVNYGYSLIIFSA